LQDLPVVMMLDRAGLVGPDGPTHHGVFDLAYLRHLPNLVVMAPGDAADLPAMFQFALGHDGPTAIRYPKAQAATVERPAAPVELGSAEVHSWGQDGMIVACGTLLEACAGAAQQLRGEGLDMGVINARFVKPLDARTILRAVAQCPFVVTVEEGCLSGGFGSAVLEAANDQGVDASRVRRLGIPDRFIEHGDRQGLLDDLGLGQSGIAATCLDLARRQATATSPSPRQTPKTVHGPGDAPNLNTPAS
jgi:1-deoxy-D-xylulose-5-phosphate synthase